MKGSESTKNACSREEAALLDDVSQSGVCGRECVYRKSAGVKHGDGGLTRQSRDVTAPRNNHRCRPTRQQLSTA